MKKLIILVILSFLFISCGSHQPIPYRPSFKETCHTGWVIRGCTSEEKVMIRDINELIDRVRNVDRASLANAFIKLTKGTDPKVLIFGEDHLATAGQIETLGAINSLAKEGDILLLEEGDRSRPQLKECFMNRIFDIYSNRQYRKTLASPGQDYSDFEASKFNRKFRDIFNHTFITVEGRLPSYDLTGIKFDDLKCYFWDLKNDLFGDPAWPLKRKGKKKRNISMVEAIKDWTGKGHRVFINTGFSHMPLGEISNILEKLDPKGIEDFYLTIKREKDRRKSTGEEYSSLAEGTSKVLWRYLETIPHSQFIHKRMLTNPYADY